MSEKPVVVAMMGDPCGVGPEVSLKALASEDLTDLCRPLLLGSTSAARKTADACGIDVSLHPISTLEAARYEPGVIDVLDPGNLDPVHVEFGTPSAACGRAVVEWIRLATELGKAGRIQAWIMAPINSQAIRLAGMMAHLDDLQPPGSYVFRISGDLRVVPIAEHLAISEVPASVTRDAVFGLTRLVHETLEAWGLPAPRIGVAGLNPHAMGVQEEDEIKPAVEEARRAGIDATGPVSPDAVFRQCIEKRFDAVVSMYHDQGQIALKTAAFTGACSIFIGLPYLMLSIPHGSAYDIAGKGTAQHKSMLEALETAARLASGLGFIR